MLSRRGLLIGIGTGLAGATPALAVEDPVTRSVLEQLQQQGFVIVDVRRTLLGRVRILANRGTLMREIVLDPRNGQILRDLVTRQGEGSPPEPQLPEYEDDDEDDGEGGEEEEDDDDDDDGDADDGGGDDDDDEGGDDGEGGGGGDDEDDD